MKNQNIVYLRECRVGGRDPMKTTVKADSHPGRPGNTLMIAEKMKEKIREVKMLNKGMLHIHDIFMLIH